MCYFLVLSRSGPIRCSVQLQRAPVGGGGACAELSSARTAKGLGLPTVCREAAASFSQGGLAECSIPEVRRNGILLSWTNPCEVGRGRGRRVASKSTWS